MKIRKKRQAASGGSNKFLLLAAAGAAVYFLFFRKSGSGQAPLPFSTEPIGFQNYLSWAGDWSTSIPTWNNMNIPSGGYGGNYTLF